MPVRARPARWTLAVWGSASAGFVVPLLLALLSPALEALLATSQSVLASLLVVLLSAGAVLLRLAGRAWLELGRLMHHVYDVAIFLPLALEQALTKRKRVKARHPATNQARPASVKIHPLHVGSAQPGSPEQINS